MLARSPTLAQFDAAGCFPETVPALPYPHPSDAAVSARMRRNPKKDTKPEVALRSALHRAGLRFRKHYAIRTPERVVRADVAFTRHRVAVFVDGCFWHCCPQHGNMPRANSTYWRPKLERNVQRDRAIDEALQDAGWTVLRAWEHEPASDVAQRVIRALRAGDVEVSPPEA